MNNSWSQLAPNQLPSLEDIKAAFSDGALHSTGEQLDLDNRQKLNWDKLAKIVRLKDGHPTGNKLPSKAKIEQWRELS